MKNKIIKMIKEEFILSLEEDTWTKEFAEAREKFDSSREIKNWNKAMNELIRRITKL